MGVSLSPAISQSPRGQLYGWLPLSNAYGISSVAAQLIIKRITAFLPLQHNTKSNADRHFFYQNVNLV